MIEVDVRQITDIIHQARTLARVTYRQIAHSGTRPLEETVAHTSFMAGEFAMSEKIACDFGYPVCARESRV